jgi:uncharacterized membrane protein YcaP (DUF421 family)
MKEYEIHLNDWMRIFVGNAPAAFYLELVLRAGFLYILLLVCMRVLGKRMSALLSRNELTALVSLAAAIGVPMLSWDRGLLPSVIICIIVVSVSKLIGRLSYDRPWFQKQIIGEPTILAENGIFNIKMMHETKIPRERLMAQLRSNNIVHLGEVKRLYIEPSGEFSIVKEIEPKPGLLVLPSNDKEFVSKRVHEVQGTICLQCGAEQESEKETGKDSCDECGEKQFIQPVMAR